MEFKYVKYITGVDRAKNLFKRLDSRKSALSQERKHRTTTSRNKREFVENI